MGKHTRSSEYSNQNPQDYLQYDYIHEPQNSILSTRMAKREEDNGLKYHGIEVCSPQVHREKMTDYQRGGATNFAGGGNYNKGFENEDVNVEIEEFIEMKHRKFERSKWSAWSMNNNN
ncbi:hypothetical protein LIER_30551 [Lithospermum erythrorhizon]|uniref:Uncharacterized protein n=1 Tax=Lithospermum erythrorhizon TaxID=34254 RepID=A0AAV3RRN7_LITER